MTTKPVLIAYTTNSGSTREVAEAVGRALQGSGCHVEIRRAEEVGNVDGFGAVIVGGPMILGWHRAARAFVARHHGALEAIPVAYFCTAMSLTQPMEKHWEGIPLALDPKLAKPPRSPGRLSFRERYASVGSYLRPILKTGGQLRPVSVAFFAGKLDLMPLGLVAQLFVMLVVQARPGDLRNWPFIESWATGLGMAWAKSGQI
jgi:menaquinone-dependent protoporphyrinogen oxidase